MIIGIDPGKSGAMFVLGPPHGRSTVPLIFIGGKERPAYSAWAQLWLPWLKTAEHVYIESAGARPGQGVTSMFSFGYSAGFVYGLVLAANVSHTFLTPQVWKKAVGLSGSDGEESRRRASQLLPECVDFWPRKKDHGIAEAALIAWVGKQRVSEI